MILAPLSGFGAPEKSFLRRVKAPCPPARSPLISITLKNPLFVHEYSGSQKNEFRPDV